MRLRIKQEAFILPHGEIRRGITLETTKRRREVRGSPSETAGIRGAIEIVLVFEIV